MTKTECIFFEKALKKIDSKKYAIYPQVSLQSIIDTDSNTRNEELFRIVDFLVVDKKEQKPL